MSPNDPRHGTNAGYKAGCRDQCCRAAAAHYERWRDYDKALGRPRTLPAIGFRRRVEALRAIGWSVNDIADAINLDVRNLSRTCEATSVYRSTHQKLAEAYERMCMRPPTDTYANRRKTIALRRGCVPPLAWDDIDSDLDPPTSSFEVIDEVRVQRVLAGIRTDCTTAERLAVIEAWNGSYSELERVTGWNVWRLLGERKVA